MNHELFKTRLKELRKENNFTQPALAEKINVTKAAIYNYEKGFRIPDELTIQKLADSLLVDKSYLKGESDFRNNKEIAEKILDSLIKNDLIKKDEPVSPELEKKIMTVIKNGINIIKDLDK